MDLEEKGWRGGDIGGLVRMGLVGTVGLVVPGGLVSACFELSRD